MNEHSVLCRLIRDDYSGWEAVMEEKHIKVKYDETKRFAIFNYDIGCDFSDPVVQEARGIIIDLAHIDVACWPFRKFGNAGESYVDIIDWTHAKVQQKIDGSICKLWFNPMTEKWQWSTNGMLNADDAPTSLNPKKSFLKLIQQADDFNNIHTDELDRNLTYIFELVSPEQKILIQYPFTRLWHIGTRNNLTGEELVTDIGLPHPEEYPLANKEDCEEAAAKLNKGREHVLYEGFVVVDPARHPDGSFSRIKIKSPEYVALHHAINNGVITKQRGIKMILDGTYKNIPSSPKVDAVIAFYDWQVKELINSVSRYMDFVRGYFEELNHDKKALAMNIRNDRLSWFGFQAIGHSDADAETLIRAVWESRRTTILKLIEDYELPPIR